jgi:hypothetical protein
MAILRQVQPMQAHVWAVFAAIAGPPNFTFNNQTRAPAQLICFRQCLTL